MVQCHGSWWFVVVRGGLMSWFVVVHSGLMSWFMVVYVMVCGDL